MLAFRTARGLLWQFSGNSPKLGSTFPIDLATSTTRERSSRHNRWAAAISDGAALGRESGRSVGGRSERLLRRSFASGRGSLVVGFAEPIER